MKLLSNTLIRRNTACVMLLIWAFALASGVANACLFDAHEAHSHASAAGQAEPDHVHAALTAHPPGSVDHDDESGTSRPACLKFCGEDSKFLPKQHFGPDTTDPGQAPLVAVLWVATMHDVPVAAARPEGLLRRAPDLPLRVQYARMAL